LPKGVYVRTEEHKAITRDAMLKFHAENPDFGSMLRGKQSRKRWTNLEEHKRASDRMKKRWVDDDGSLIESLKVAQKLANEVTRENVKNPEYLRKLFYRRPMSKPEMDFQRIVDENDLPYEFVGNVENKSLVIGGKVPDFAHKSEKKLVEIYGEFYHKGQNPQDRIDFFKQHGYDCVVFWASELKDSNKILEVLS